MLVLPAQALAFFAYKSSASVVCGGCGPGRLRPRYAPVPTSWKFSEFVRASAGWSAARPGR